MADPVAVNVTVFLALLTTGLAVVLLAVGLLSWWRLRSARAGAIAAAFGLLAAKGAWTSWQVIASREPQVVTATLDALVLALFYLSVAKR